MISRKRRQRLRAGQARPTGEETKFMQRLVYKNLVSTNPQYVEECLRERKKGLVATLMMRDPGLPETKAQKQASRIMWWAPKN